MLNRTRFILGKFAPISLSYDVADYYGLGKFGKRNVVAGDLWPVVISASNENIDELLLVLSSEGIRDKDAFNALVGRLGKEISEKVVLQLKAMAAGDF